MPRFRRVLATWLLERILEVTFSTLLVFYLIRPAKGVGSGSIIEELGRTTAAPLFYYVFTGYGLSCILFGLLFRSFSHKVHPPLMAATYAVHAMIFLFFFGRGAPSEIFVTLGLGIVIVWVSNFIGSYVITDR